MEVTLRVPAHYALDAWFASASPEEVADALDVAARVVRFVTERGDDKRLVRDAYEEVLARRDGTHAATLLDLTQRAERAETESFDLRMRLQEKEHAIELNTQRLEALAAHAEETFQMRMEAAVRAARAETQNDHAALQRAHDQLTTSLQEQMERARADAAAVAQEAARADVEALRAQVHTLHDAKMAHEEAACAHLRATCEKAENHATEVADLRTRIAELETPMGRGRAGEVDVAQTLRDAGFAVEDTSMGERRDAGYLDLLVQPEGSEDTNLRIAVELKNVRVVQKEYRDDFERKVKEGVRKDLFDAAIFLSIRAHTKKGGCVVLEMYPDEGNRPLVPVTWLGPEKGKAALPLTQEQVETHVHMMCGLLSQCHHIRRELCNGLRDDNVAKLQTFFDQTGAHFNETFADLAKQQKLLDDMKANLTGIRARAIAMFTSLWQHNREVHWLGRTIHAPWMEAYMTARDRAQHMDEARVWNQCSRNKSLIERSIGKDAMFQAIRASKRPRESDEEV